MIKMTIRAIYPPPPSWVSLRNDWAVFTCQLVNQKVIKCQFSRVFRASWGLWHDWTGPSWMPLVLNERVEASLPELD